MTVLCLFLIGFSMLITAMNTPFFDDKMMDGVRKEDRKNVFFLRLCPKQRSKPTDPPRTYRNNAQNYPIYKTNM